MRRRTLLNSLSVAAAISSTGLRAHAGPKRQARQVLELRTYSFASADKQATFESFLGNAGIPAWNRAGVQPVGVFKVLAADNPDNKAADAQMQLYVLLPHNTFEAFSTCDQRLSRDAVLARDGGEVLAAQKSDPAFLRWQSTLLMGFAGWPRVTVPKFAAPADRVFELRTYESHNEERAQNKVSMFEHGEFPIFERAGMYGVLFGTALAGSGLPQLTYMVAHKSQQDIKANWKAFFNDLQWKRLSSEAAYKDNVSKVDSRFLTPTSASQV